MASLKTLAVRVLDDIIGRDTKAEGWYLKPSEYENFKNNLTAVIEECTASHDALARLVEAALASDNSDLFYALYKYVEWDSFEYVVDNYFGLVGFYVYCSTACLTVYLDLIQMEDPATWAETCEERLFEELESDFWALDWSQAWGNPLAILYLLHFKGGISATSLLKKSVQHGFTAYYAPLRALGGRFDVDDMYSANHDTEDLRMLIANGFLETLKTDAKPEDWTYLVEKLLE